MERSESIAELAGALAKAQAAMQPAIKDRANPAFKGSKYADLNAIWDACRAVLTTNGLSVVQMPLDGGEGRVALATMLLHASGQYIQSTVSAPLTKNDAQGVGSALTYLRRYALAAMVGIVADDDDGGNAASQRPTATFQSQNGHAPTGMSDAQRKKLWATMQANQWDEASVISWVAEHGIVVTRLGELTMKQASMVIDLLTQAAA